MMSLVHSKMDATIIFEQGNGNNHSFRMKNYSCLSAEAIVDTKGPSMNETTRKKSVIQGIGSKADVKMHGPEVYREAFAEIKGLHVVDVYSHQMAYRCAKTTGDW